MEKGKDRISHGVSAHVPSRRAYIEGDTDAKRKRIALL
jgi:hypothetical protein